MPPGDSADLLIEARWLLPMAPQPGAPGGQAVAVHEGRIVAVGPAEALRTRFAAAERIVRPHHVLMPGFVNAHTEAASILLRGLPVVPPLMRWHESIRPLEERFVRPDFVRDGTCLAVAEMLRAGITTFADTSAFPEEAARAVETARVRAVIGLPVAENPTAWAGSAAEHLEKGGQLWDEYRSSPWVSLQFAPQPPYELSDDTLDHVRRVADELDARIAMRVHETEVEVHDSLMHHGRRPLRRLADLGLLRPGFTALHMNRLDEEDFELTAHTGISVVACLQSNLRLGSGRCPLKSLTRRGVTTGLGSDAPLRTGAIDLLEARAAALSGTADEPITAMDALRLATIGSAAALGMAATIGSVETGKAADLICIDVGAAAHHPPASIADAVLFGATRQHVTDVWMGGRAAVTSGRLIAFDEEELSQLAQEWAARVHQGARP